MEVCKGEEVDCEVDELLPEVADVVLDASREGVEPCRGVQDLQRVIFVVKVQKASDTETRPLSLGGLFLEFRED